MWPSSRALWPSGCRLSLPSWGERRPVSPSHLRRTGGKSANVCPAAVGGRARFLRDDLRSDLANRHLADRDLAISQIAWLLGYHQDVGAFSHAFKRWTGKTPGQRAPLKCTRYDHRTLLRARKSGTHPQRAGGNVECAPQSCSTEWMLSRSMTAWPAPIREACRGAA